MCFFGLLALLFFSAHPLGLRFCYSLELNFKVRLFSGYHFRAETSSGHSISHSVKDQISRHWLRSPSFQLEKVQTRRMERLGNTGAMAHRSTFLLLSLDCLLIIVECFFHCHFHPWCKLILEGEQHLKYEFHPRFSLSPLHERHWFPFVISRCPPPRSCWSLPLLSYGCSWFFCSCLPTWFFPFFS